MIEQLHERKTRVMKYTIKYLPFCGGAKIYRNGIHVKTFYSGCDPGDVIYFFVKLLNKILKEKNSHHV